MSQFRDAYGEFRRAEAQVAALSVDSPYCHRAWAKDMGGVPFPLLSDFNRDFARAYDILAPGSPLISNTTSRSAFVVDGDGIVRYAWYAPAPRGFPDVQEVLKAAQAIGSR